MNKQALWGSIALASTLALTGCNSGGSSDSGSDTATTTTTPTTPTTPTVEPSSDDISFTLLQTTDLHHHAETYAQLATQIEAVRKDKGNDAVSLIDSGDFLMGTAYDMTLMNASQTSAAFQFLKDMQYSVITLGNHEFDYGDTALATMLDNSSKGEGGFPPVVVTNMDATKSLSIQKHVDSKTIQQSFTQTLFEGTEKELKVGYVGLMGPASITTITNAPNVTFDKSFTAKAIQDEVNKLKNEGANLIIALSHSGLTDPNNAEGPIGDDAEYAKKIEGIDIIATGHAHRLVEPVGEAQAPLKVNNTYIFGGGAYGDFLSQLDITFNKQAGSITSVKLKNHDITAVKADLSVPVVKQINDGIESTAGSIAELAGVTGLNQVMAKLKTEEAKAVFKNSEELAESGLGNLLADASRHAYTENGVNTRGSDYTIAETPVAFVANGVIRSDFSKSQDITFANVYDTLSLGLSINTEQQDKTGSPLFAAYLTAQELKNIASLISYGQASQDKAYMVSLATVAGQVPGHEQDIIAAGINTTKILGDFLAGKGLKLEDIISGDLDLGKLKEAGIDATPLLGRLKELGIDVMGILMDPEMKILEKLQKGEDVDLDFELMQTKNLLDLALLDQKLKEVDSNLGVMRLMSVIGEVMGSDGISLNEEAIDVIFSVIDMLEPAGNDGINTSDKIQAMIKLAIISKMQPEWFLNTAGLRTTFLKKENTVENAVDNYEVAKIELYNAADIYSQNASIELTDIEADTLYPVIADQYMLLLMYGKDFSMLRSLPWFSIQPKRTNGSVIEFDIEKESTYKNLTDMAIKDADGKEVKAWQALQNFFISQSNSADAYEIDDNLYNAEAIKNGELSSRVNFCTDCNDDE